MLIHLLAPKYSLLKINRLSRVQIYTPDCWRLRSAMRSLTPPTTMTEFRCHKRNFCGWELPYRPFWSLITQFSYLSTSSLPRSLLLLACLCLVVCSFVFWTWFFWFWVMLQIQKQVRLAPLWKLWVLPEHWDPEVQTVAMWGVCCSGEKGQICCSREQWGVLQEEEAVVSKHV